MDIDGVERCPRCFSLWDETACSSCSYKATEEGRTSTSQLEQETILQGHYLIGSVLGAGGFGITYAAWDLKLDVPVAIKEFFPSGLAARDTSSTDEVETHASEENARAFAAGLNRFIREARVLALLNTCAEIVSIRDCIQENNTAYIIMEYLRGKNLFACATDSGGHVPPKELLPMMRAPIEALAKIHEMGMLHRDVSPENLMLEPDGHVKLIDFGAVMEYMQAQDATVILNRRYAAPEQYLPDGALGPWTDVYGVCATLYTLLTGKTPQEASTGLAGAVPPLRAQGVKITRRQEHAILRGLAENPKHRIGSMPELLSPLYGMPLPEEIRRRKRIKRIVKSTALVMALLGFVAMINAAVGFPGGDGAFYRFGGRGGGVALLRYTGDADVFINRDSFLGIPVKSIASAAFRSEKLIEVNISESVEYIENNAFTGCWNLEAVRLPDNVSLGYNAFAWGRELTLYGKVSSSAHRTALSQGWRFCDPSLFDATIEKGEATLQSMRWWGEGIDIVYVPPLISGAPVTVIDTQGALPSFALGLMPGELAPLVPRQLILPNTVRRIEENAFYGLWRLEGVSLPNGLESIGSSAFALSGLRSLSIPNMVMSIGMDAFRGCTQLKEIRLPDRLAVIEQGAFERCESLEKIALPARLRSIERGAFASCGKLTEIAVPDGTEHIGDIAFRNCRQLARVVIPTSVTSIGEDAFIGCAPDLTIYGFAGSTAEAYARENDLDFVVMALWTPKEAFTYEAGEDGITITAFKGYTGRYVDVVVPDYIGGVAVTKLADRLFAGNDALRSVELPRMVKVLPIGLFDGCSSLVSVKLPEGLREIALGAFFSCTSLPALTFPSTMTRIDQNAFRGSQSLENVPYRGGWLRRDAGDQDLANDALRSVVFQEGTWRIDSGLGVLENLEEAVIPESVQYIAPDAFECSEKKLTIRGVKGSYAEGWAREKEIAFEEIK